MTLGPVLAIANRGEIAARIARTAQALGWQAGDGCLPWAARLARQDGIADVDGRAWGLLTPVHWTVSAEGVALVDPDALSLGAAESRALFDAVRDLFDRAFAIAGDRMSCGHFHDARPPLAAEAEA